MPIKTFLNGYPLPASELQTYLMNQAVMTFASSTARAAAITSPNEGMLTWLEDVDKYQYHNGTTWVDLVPDTSAMVTLTGTQTVTNKTFSSSAFQSLNLENCYISSTGFAGFTYYANTNGQVQYITANSTANGLVNITAASGVTLNSVMAVGQSITLVLAITNGTTGYYPNSWQIDGSAVTPKWLGGTAPTSGNASAIDLYSLSIIKTASATFTVIASQAKAA